MSLINLDDGFREDGVVDDPTPVVERSGKFSDGGVFSERIFGRMPSSGREYACECGAVEGRFHEGTTCQKCDTVVTCRDTVFSKRGWVDLGGYKILSPLFFTYVGKVVGPSQLIRILHQKKILTVDGLTREDESAGPYDGIGILGFEQRWEEVLDHYEQKRGRQDPRVSEYATLIRENADKLLTSKIPVFSHILRPALVVDRQLIFDEVNNVFNLLVANVQALDEYSDAERTEANINSVLWRIQERANEVFEHVLHVLSGKGGYLRSSLLGVRVNFSSRCVIVPLRPGHEQDEVEIPYLAFLELYRFQLTNLISRLRGVDVREANAVWSRAQTKFDRSVYQAMKEMIKRSESGGLPCLLNRNPTIPELSSLKH